MRRHFVIAGVILVIALAIRIAAWCAYPNIIWPDEIFQSLEQAHRVVFGVGVVPWEFREGSRSWLLPGTLAVVMKATSAITSSVTAYLVACAGALSLISLAPVWAVFRSTIVEFGLRGALVAAVACTCWFELVYFAPKALNEVVAGNCLAAGVLIVDGCVREYRAFTRSAGRKAIVASLMLALASMLRIQIAPAALLCFLYLIHGLPARDRRTCFGAAAAVVVGVGMLDALTWNYPFQSVVENVRINVFEGRSARYGVAPWYAYFVVSARLWALTGLFILVAAIVGARVRPLLAVSMLVVLATHIPIGHKEYRFAYPAVLMAIMLAGIGSAQLVEWARERTSQRTGSFVAAAISALWIAASLRGAVGFDESKSRLSVPFGPPQWHWVLHRGGLLAMQELGEAPDVCGVGLMGFYGVQTFATGGYTYLHRDIPIFEVSGPGEIARVRPYANALLVAARASTSEQIGDFGLDHCVAEACIFRRSGSCQVMPGYSYNDVLMKAGL